MLAARAKVLRRARRALVQIGQICVGTAVAW